MNGTRHEKIEAERLLMAKFPHPVGEYQRGWNEALQAAFEAETGRKIKEVEHERVDSCNRAITRG
jgi:hypothetical protein